MGVFVLGVGEGIRKGRIRETETSLLLLSLLAILAKDTYIHMKIFFKFSDEKGFPSPLEVRADLLLQHHGTMKTTIKKKKKIKLFLTARTFPILTVLRNQNSKIKSQN